MLIIKSTDSDKCWQGQRTTQGSCPRVYTRQTRGHSPHEEGVRVPPSGRLHSSRKAETTRGLVHRKAKHTQGNMTGP